MPTYAETINITMYRNLKRKKSQKKKQTSLQKLARDLSNFKMMSYKQGSKRYTQMCSYITDGQPCPHKNCWYAHSENELRKRPETRIKKSVRCVHGEDCPYGPKFNNGVNKCKFLHEWLGEKGHVSYSTMEKHMRSGKFKTKDCRSWKTSGECAYGEKCAFKHDPKYDRRQKQAMVIQCAWRCFRSRNMVARLRNQTVYIEICGAENVSLKNLKVLKGTNIEVKQIIKDSAKDEMVLPLPQMKRQTSEEFLREVKNVALLGSYNDFCNDVCCQGNHF